MDENSINLSAIERCDPSANKIIACAKQVALYTYRIAQHKWEKDEFEGSLFIYARSAVPFYGMIILNRLSQTNYIQPITVDADVSEFQPYVLYKKRDGDVKGIWFYDRNECAWIFQHIINLIQELKQKAPNGSRKPSAGPTLSEIFGVSKNAKPRVPMTTNSSTTNNGDRCQLTSAAPVVALSASAQRGDILSLLNKATDNYNGADSSKSFGRIVKASTQSVGPAKTGLALQSQQMQEALLPLDESVEHERKIIKPMPIRLPSVKPSSQQEAAAALSPNIVSDGRLNGFGSGLDVTSTPKSSGSKSRLFQNARLFSTSPTSANNGCGSHTTTGPVMSQLGMFSSSSKDIGELRSSHQDQAALPELLQRLLSSGSLGQLPTTTSAATSAADGLAAPLEARRRSAFSPTATADPGPADPLSSPEKRRLTKEIEQQLKTSLQLFAPSNPSASTGDVSAGSASSACNSVVNITLNKRSHSPPSQNRLYTWPEPHKAQTTSTSTSVTNGPTENGRPLGPSSQPAHSESGNTSSATITSLAEHSSLRSADLDLSFNNNGVDSSFMDDNNSLQRRPKSASGDFKIMPPPGQQRPIVASWLPSPPADSSMPAASAMYDPFSHSFASPLELFKSAGTISAVSTMESSAYANTGLANTALGLGVDSLANQNLTNHNSADSCLPLASSNSLSTVNAQQPAAIRASLVLETVTSPLSKQELQKAFIWLLKNDAEFMDKLHDAYRHCVQEESQSQSNNS